MCQKKKDSLSTLLLIIKDLYGGHKQTHTDITRIATTAFTEFWREEMDTGMFASGRLQCICNCERLKFIYWVAYTYYKCIFLLKINYLFIKYFKKGYLIKKKIRERSGTIWNDLERSGTIWNDLERYGTIWNDMERYGTIWNDMERYGTIWNDMERYGTIWNDMERYGTIWNDMERYGTIWNDMERYGTIWNDMERYGTIWNDMERYGTIWNDMERYGTIWNDMERYGTIWNDMERYGTIWNDMELQRSGTFVNVRRTFRQESYERPVL
jgi:hypothetical protein